MAKDVVLNIRGDSNGDQVMRQIKELRFELGGCRTCPGYDPVDSEERRDQFRATGSGSATRHYQCRQVRHINSRTDGFILDADRSDR